MGRKLSLYAKVHDCNFWKLIRYVEKEIKNKSDLKEHKTRLYERQGWICGNCIYCKGSRYFGKDIIFCSNEYHKTDSFEQHGCEDFERKTL